MATNLPPSQLPVRVPPREAIAPFVFVQVEDSNGIDVNSLQACVSQETGAACATGGWPQVCMDQALKLPSEPSPPFQPDVYSVGRDVWVSVTSMPPNTANLHFGCVPSQQGDVPSAQHLATHLPERVLRIVEAYSAKRKSLTVTWSAELWLNRSSTSITLTERSPLRSVFVNDTSVQFLVALLAAGAVLVVNAYPEALKKFPQDVPRAVLSAAGVGLVPVGIIVAIWVLLAVAWYLAWGRKRIWTLLGWN